MDHSLLQSVYDPENFRKLGHQLVDQLADLLAQNLEQVNDKVIDWTTPEEEYQFWVNQSSSSPDEIFQLITQRAIKLHHPKFMGHQVAVPAPSSSLAAFQGALLNNGMAVYEMGASATALERLVIERLMPYFGFNEGTGILTSGGTIANLTAMICARNIKAPENVWQEGQTEKYGFMVSEEAHYCIDRAARVMGWGDAGVIKVPVDDNYTMRVDLLQAYYDKAMSQGITVLGIVGSAPTTSTGKYDDLQAIGEFCQSNNLWFHIDGAHGGPAAFSETHKPLMHGSHLADSITVDAHKMMMAPALTTILFFKNNQDSYKTFAQKAQYLWGASDEEWYNYGKRTMECTKIMLSTRIYILLQTYGVAVFGQYLDACYANGKLFADIIGQTNWLQLAVPPDSNIVCFRVLADSDDVMNTLNRQIRQHLLEDGHFYIVQTLLQGQVYLRVTLMHPFTNESDMRALLSTIQTIKTSLE